MSTVTIRATFVVCAKQAKFFGRPWAGFGSYIAGFVLTVFLAQAQTEIYKLFPISQSATTFLQLCFTIFFKPIFKFCFKIQPT